MNTKTSTTPFQSKSKLAIQPRRVRFNYDDIDDAAFFGDNIVSSAFYVALSLTFPAGEAEFIRSVMNFDKQIADPKLKEDVRDFAAQEAHHGLQHRKLNQKFAEIGYATSEVESLIDEKLAERSIHWSPAKRLRRTVAAEHFTATMAHQALSNPASLNPAPAVFKDLMLWHAIEEIEHKSVTFDVYQHCVGDMRALRWHYLHFACIEFPLQFWLITRFLLKRGGFKVTWRDRRKFLKQLFGKGGIYSSVFGLYLAFLSPSFHPWKHDDSGLVGKWKERLAHYFLQVDGQRV